MFIEFVVLVTFKGLVTRVLLLLVVDEVLLQVIISLLKLLFSKEEVL